MSRPSHSVYYSIICASVLRQVYQRISSFVSSSEWYFEHPGDHSSGGTPHAERPAQNGAYISAPMPSYTSSHRRKEQTQRCGVTEPLVACVRLLFCDAISFVCMGVRMAHQP